MKRHAPSEIIGVDEFLELRKSVLVELNRTDSDTPDEAPPGEESDITDDQTGANVVCIIALSYLFLRMYIFLESNSYFCIKFCGKEI